MGQATPRPAARDRSGRGAGAALSIEVPGAKPAIPFARGSRADCAWMWLHQDSAPVPDVALAWRLPPAHRGGEGLNPRPPPPSGATVATCCRPGAARAPAPVPGAAGWLYGLARTERPPSQIVPAGAAPALARDPSDDMGASVGVPPPRLGRRNTNERTLPGPLRCPGRLPAGPVQRGGGAVVGLVGLKGGGHSRTKRTTPGIRRATSHGPTPLNGGWHQDSTSGDCVEGLDKTPPQQGTEKTERCAVPSLHNPNIPVPHGRLSRSSVHLGCDQRPCRDAAAVYGKAPHHTCSNALQNNRKLPPHNGNVKQIPHNNTQWDKSANVASANNSPLPYARRVSNPWNDERYNVMLMAAPVYFRPVYMCL